MRIVSTLAGMLAGAAAATLITLGTGASASIQPVPMRTPAHHHEARQLPRWFHWGNTNDRQGGKPCIIVWGGHSESALICEKGWPDVSS